MSISDPKSYQDGETLQTTPPWGLLFFDAKDDGEI